MQGTMVLNQWSPNLTVSPSFNLDNIFEKNNDISENTTLKIINMKDYTNTPIKKTMSFTNTSAVDYFNVSTSIETFKYSHPVELNNHTKRLVIDMNYELEIERIIKRYRNMHLVLFIISLFVIIASWTPSIVSKEIAIVIKPMSIAFSLMVIINYYTRRLK